VSTPPQSAVAAGHGGVRASVGADSQRRAGIAFIVVSALAFGAMAIMARIAYAAGVDTTTLLALRFAIAAVCMLALLRARGVALPRGSHLAALVLLGALGYGGQAFSFFTALTLAPASLTALLLYLHPALVALLAAWLLRERISRVKLVALVAALCGMALTVAPALAAGGVAAFPRIGAGIAFGIAAASIYAIYIVASTRVAAHVAPMAMATVVIASAAVLFATVAIARGPQWPQSVEGWLAVAGIALVSTVAAISLFFAGLARIGPTQASTLSTIEPVFTVLLAAMLLGESIAPIQLVGGALILGAVLLLARAPNASKPT
jgi:drug/metabolite transporter (DMT)-like permease